MIKFAIAILQGISKYIGLLLVIVAALLLAEWLRQSFIERHQLADRMANEATLAENLQQDLHRINEDIATQSANWQARRQKITQQLESELSELDAVIQQAETTIREQIDKLSNYDDFSDLADKKVQQAKDDLAELEEQKKFWTPLSNPGLLVKIKSTKETLKFAEDKLRDAQAKHKKLTQHMDKGRAVLLHEQKKEKENALAKAKTARSPDEQVLFDEKARKEKDIAAITSSITSLEGEIAHDPKQRIVTQLIKHLPSGLKIFALIVFLPLLTKLFSFYVVAPTAGKLKPIRILPNEDAPPIPPPAPSAVSIALDLQPEEEVLVHADFLQSSSQTSVKRTQWFLNKRLPFTSIASGMCLLTRIRPVGALGTRVMVSAQHDHFEEIGCIKIPAGAAIVLHPRSLAGLVKQQGTPSKITKHWRLFSIHAWCTLQLRYLAFHGPCNIIVKGCRGIRSEEPDADHPRVINQNATLGFSANLEYRNTRCETFISYFRGKEQLFNDQFSGGPGRFIYEESANSGAKGGLAGRGIQAFFDALLKVFGI